MNFVYPSIFEEIQLHISGNPHPMDIREAFNRQMTTLSWLKRVPSRDIRILRRKIVGFEFNYPDRESVRMSIRRLIPQPAMAAYRGPRILVWAEVQQFHPSGATRLVDINLDTLIVLMALADVLNERDPTLANYRSIATAFRRYIQLQRQNWEIARAAMRDEETGNFDLSCPICFDDVTEQDFYHLNCSIRGHVLHRSCWDSIRASRGHANLRCPVCNIPARQYEKKSRKSRKSKKSKSKKSTRRSRKLRRARKSKGKKRQR